MRVSVVVEQAWDPASIEVGPVGGVDWSRAVPVPVPGSLEALELALGLGEARVLGLGLATVDDLLRTCLAMGAAGVARAPDLFAVAAALRVEAGEAVAVRRLDRGEREEVVVPLPAVVAVEPGIVRPRVATPAAVLAALSAPVPSLPAAAPAARALLRGQGPPRPAPPRLAAPDPALTAEARIAAIVDAMAGAARHELATGSPDEVADRIVRFLAERGYV